MNSSDELSQQTGDSVASTPNTASPDQVRISILEEQIRVSKQTIETGRVILTKTVHETDETVTVPLLQEGYVVERIALNQYVDELPLARQEGDTTVYPIVKEVLVVQKRLVLIEEIRVYRQQIQTEESQTVQLRREDITVERTPFNPERPA